MEAKKFNDKELETRNCVEEEEKPKQRLQNKKKMPVEMKKKVVSRKSKSLKSKAKKVNSDTATKSGSKRKRTAIHDIYDDVEAKFTVMERAERVLTSLGDEAPYFVKCMLPSNVTYSFWLNIPKRFCDLHLPSRDSTVILVDEWGKEHKTTYLIDRHGLSAGWRGFSISHRLLKGDILIFRLTEPCKLLVHIVRVNGLDVVNAALCLMNMDAFGKTSDSGLGKSDKRKHKKAKKFTEPSILDPPNTRDIFQDKGQGVLSSNLVTVADKPENNSEGLGSDILEGPDVTNQLMSGDHRFTENPFLREHPCKGVTCSIDVGRRT